MGRRRDDDRTRQNRTRQYPGGYDRRGYDERDYERRNYRDGDLFGPYQDSRGNTFYEDRDGYRHYEERPPAPYERERDREREGYWREREQRQETRRTGMIVLGAIAVAVIALIGAFAVTGGDDSSQTAQQAPPQLAPQQPAQPQQPEAPQQDGASAEQVEVMQPDIEHQLAEIRQSINQLRFEIWSFFGGQQSNKQDTQQ